MKVIDSLRRRKPSPSYKAVSDIISRIESVELRLFESLPAPTSIMATAYN